MYSFWRSWVQRKKNDLQNRMYAFRFDDTIEDDDKELDLKQMADELNELEAKILEQVRGSTDTIIEQLALKSGGGADFFEGRKKNTPGSKGSGAGSRTGSSAGGLISPRIMNSSSGGPFAPPPHVAARAGQDETPFFRPPSAKVLDSGNTRKSRGGLNTLFKSFSDHFGQKEDQSELVLLEQEIATLRAALVSMEGKKNPSRTQQRMIDDLREQLKLKVAHKEKYFREQYNLKELIYQEKEKGLESDDE